MQHQYVAAVMKETFVIQPDISALPILEEQIFHFCHLCNVGNYHAAISVATQQAVEQAIIAGDKVELKVECGTNRGGLFVRLTSTLPCFASSMAKASVEDADPSLFIMQRLSDRFMVEDNGCALQMEFDVNGIDPRDAKQRVEVLQRCMWMSSLATV